MEVPSPPRFPLRALTLLVLAAPLLWGCSGKKEDKARPLSFSPLAYFPSSTRLLAGMPSPSALAAAGGPRIPEGLEKAFLDQAGPGGFGPLDEGTFRAAWAAWKLLEKKGAAPETAWLGSELSGKDPLDGCILVLDFKEGRGKGFLPALEEILSGKKDSPGGWSLARPGKGGKDACLLRKGKSEIRLRVSALGEAVVLVFGRKGVLDRVRAARSGKGPSLRGAAWAARVKESVAEGWPSWALAPGAPGKGVFPSLLARAGLPLPETLFERWAPGEGENLLEAAYGEDSGYPWALGRLSVDPDVFASLLPADTEAFLLGAWDTAWVKEKLVPILNKYGGEIGWLNDLLNQVESILGLWKEEGCIPYEMISKKMLSFGIALRPSGGEKKPDVLVAFGVPLGEESWFSGWLERGYRTQVFPGKAWWGKTNYLIYERKKEPAMAGTTGKGHLFLASSRKRLIGWLEAAEGRTARLSDTGAFKALRLSFRDPADLFFFVSPKSPGGPFRLLPGFSKDFGALGVGPFGGGIFLRKGKIRLLSRWPLSPWNLALRAGLLGR